MPLNILFDYYLSLSYNLRAPTLSWVVQVRSTRESIGQKKNVTYVDIIAEDTIDEKIVKALRDKINIASQVLGEELKAWI